MQVYSRTVSTGDIISIPQPTDSWGAIAIGNLEEANQQPFARKKIGNSISPPASFMSAEEARKKILDRWPLASARVLDRKTLDLNLAINKSYYLKVDSISILKEMPISHLNLSRTGSGVLDISALKGMPLRELNLHRVIISDLEPIRGIPLTYLDLHKSEITDFNTLRGMPLEYLDIGRTGVTDLNFLRNSNLKTLILSKCLSLRNISPLSDTNIEVLNLTESRSVTSLDPLRNLPLKKLWIQDGTLLEGNEIKNFFENTYNKDNPNHDLGALTDSLSKENGESDLESNIKDKLSDDCIVYYKFDNEKEYNTHNKKKYILDQSGEENHGLIFNTRITDGIDKKGIEFPEGKNGFIRIPFSNSLSIKDDDGITVSVWAKVFKGSRKGKNWLVKGPGYALIYNYQGHHILKMGFNGITCRGKTPNSELDDEWHHYTGTYDPRTATVRVYVDGVLEGEMQGQKSPSPEGDIWIMSGSKHMSPFYGILDELRIWKRCLDENEVRSIVNQ